MRPSWPQLVDRAGLTPADVLSAHATTVVAAVAQPQTLFSDVRGLSRAGGGRAGSERVRSRNADTVVCGRYTPATDRRELQDKDGFRTAALRALTTLAPIAPEAIVRETLVVVNRLVNALDAEPVTDFALAVYKTEPGQLYVDGARQTR